MKVKENKTVNVTLVYSGSLKHSAINVIQKIHTSYVTSQKKVTSSSLNHRPTYHYEYEYRTGL